MSTISYFLEWGTLNPAPDWTASGQEEDIEFIFFAFDLLTHSIDVSDERNLGFQEDEFAVWVDGLEFLELRRGSSL